MSRNIKTTNLKFILQKTTSIINNFCFYDFLILELENKIELQHKNIYNIQNSRIFINNIIIILL